MASDGFRHASQQEALYSSSSMRTNHNEIGMPFRCGIEDAHSDVTYLDSGTRLKSRSTQLLRKSLDEFERWLLLLFQLRSVALGHLWRSHERYRFQHV